MMRPNSSLADIELLTALKHERDPHIGCAYADNRCLTASGAYWWSVAAEVRIGERKKAERKSVMER